MGEDLPVPVEIIQQALDSRAMVRNRRGLGGPQPEEVARMLEEQGAELAHNRAWLEERRRSIAESERSLNYAFAKVRAGAGG